MSELPDALTIHRLESFRRLEHGDAYERAYSTVEGVPLHEVGSGEEVPAYQPGRKLYRRELTYFGSQCFWWSPTPPENPDLHVGEVENG